MQPHSPFPSTCFELLLLFSQKRIVLTHEDFDAAFSTVLDALEEVNNCKYLLVAREEA